MRNEFETYDIPLPDDYRSESNFRAAVSALLSAKRGRPVGYDFDKLIQVAHNVADAHKNLALLFGWALRIYGTDKVVAGDDRKGFWAVKAQTIRDAVKARDPSYVHNTNWDGTLRFLFPEIAHKIPPSR